MRSINFRDWVGSWHQLFTPSVIPCRFLTIFNLATRTATALACPNRTLVELSVSIHLLATHQESSAMASSLHPKVDFNHDEHIDDFKLSEHNLPWFLYSLQGSLVADAIRTCSRSRTPGRGHPQPQHYSQPTAQTLPCAQNHSLHPVVHLRFTLSLERQKQGHISATRGREATREAHRRPSGTL